MYTMHFDFHRQPIEFSEPIHIVSVVSIDEVIPALQKVQQWVQKGYYAAGYLSYEAAPAFDPSYVVNQVESDLPLVFFGIYTKPQISQIAARSADFEVSDWGPATDPQRYQQSIQAIHEAISRGETYQVNYTLRMHARITGDATGLYQKMNENQQAEYGAYLQIGPYQILSASPELFFHKKGDQIITKPMKGTAARGRYLTEDEKQAAGLYESEKDRAENLMIVDLLRNDLGKICLPGSVEVTRLFEIEKYPTVFQMTSTIEGKLCPEIQLEDIFTALFPCGSITGAPKIETMKHIKRLEDSPRGVYCGSIGFIEPNGNALFNVAIRTVLVDSRKNKAEFGVGGGITWDSTVKGEYEEVINKTKLLTKTTSDFELLETILLEKGEYFLLQQHLDRMEKSAVYFGISYDRVAVRTELEKYKQEDYKQPYRVRLLVNKFGKISVEGNPFQQDHTKELLVRLAEQPVQSKYLFLFHKTTQRSVYNERRMEDPALFDTLLWNESGEITEFTLGNVIVQIDGVNYTPPLTSGLLPGTYREELLRKGELHERVLLHTDLEKAEGIWFINSVRKKLKVRLI
ncbi:aminodeoxychorismate synthase component I [Ammoniphilus resinae]|uniref:Para-aminobenzoate synthetase/4-amino-4-deoxychorismate lyase n=1 Tax=Ammoniphilus resinae TaxID=861532 RepID=A0ABS4GM83_9BACL|nr:aminodeoxychorismate synthase component I [Ammoniphilus resinae]MBP1931378.1 para-aminobenzoate synthetase/4-amino-4-deoxychorismate lyase [Ammoniphilus resinae]